MTYDSSTAGIKQFAADLAKIFGGTVVAPNMNDTRIRVDNTELLITASKERGKVAISVIAPDIPWGVHFQGDNVKLPEARITIDGKDIGGLSNTVKRRLLVPAVEPLAERRRQYASKLAADRGVAGTAERIKTELPTLRVDERDNPTCPRIRSGTGHYLYARIDLPDRVTIERLGTLTYDQFKAICAIIYPTEA